MIAPSSVPAGENKVRLLASGATFTSVSNLRLVCMVSAVCVSFLSACASADPFAAGRALDGQCLDVGYSRTPCDNGTHEYIVESYGEPGVPESCANETEAFRPWPAGGGHCLSRVSRVDPVVETVEDWANRNEDVLTNLAVAVQRLQWELQDPSFLDDRLAAMRVDQLAIELRDAVDAAAAAAPVPDARIQAAWSEALDAQRSAANAVRVASAGGDEAAAQAAVDALVEAGGRFAEVGRLLSG